MPCSADVRAQIQRAIICFMFLTIQCLKCFSSFQRKNFLLTHSSWLACVDVASRTIRLNTSLFWASLPASVGLICSHSLMSSVHLLVGRPFLLLPSSLPSNMCLSRESCLFRWPKYDSFLALMLFNNQSWPTFSSFRISVFFSFCYP